MTLAAMAVDDFANADGTAGGPAWPLPLPLLSRIEDAGLNASAPPQQRWLDGWLVRTCPGKAKRARCVQTVADGRLPLDERLDRAARAMAEAGLPMVLRITPFSRPEGLDEQLAQRGWTRWDDTRVMVADLAGAAVQQAVSRAAIQVAGLARSAAGDPPQTALRSMPLASSTPGPGEAATRNAILPGDESEPPAFHVRQVAPAQLAQVVGQLRGSPQAQRDAHAQRLAQSPVPYQGWLLCATGSDAAGPADPIVDGLPVWCCAQAAREDDVVGLYDVFTAPAARGRGLAHRLCATLLAGARAEGVRWAYLQVDADNHAARTVYRRLGFADAFAYHYRAPPGVDVS